MVVCQIKVYHNTKLFPSRFAAHIEREETTGTRPFFELFDNENDPWQLKNIGEKDEFHDLVERLSDELLTWMKHVDDPLLKGPLVTPYYKKSLRELIWESDKSNI